MLQVVDAEEQVILRNFNDALDGNLSPSSGAVLDEGEHWHQTGRNHHGRNGQTDSGGEDLVMIYPTDGTSAIPDATNCQRNETFRECTVVLDFAVSQDAQRLVEEAFCAEPSVMICRKTTAEDNRFKGDRL